MLLLLQLLVVVVSIPVDVGLIIPVGLGVVGWRCDHTTVRGPDGFDHRSVSLRTAKKEKSVFNFWAYFLIT